MEAPEEYTRKEALYQSLSASGAALVAFHGILHEVVGPLLFAWGPPAFGLFVWHGLGIGLMVVGALMFLGALRRISFPVRSAAVVICVLGVSAVVFMAMSHAQFHFFALCLALIGIFIAFFERQRAIARPVDESPDSEGRGPLHNVRR